MAEQFAAPPINPLVSITPLSTPAANRDATGVPPQLANIAPGTTIEGFVINRDANANPIVRTGVGDVLVKSDVFIKTGSEIIFRVDTTQPGHARIVTIDGMEPHLYAAQNTRGMSGDTVNASLPPGAAANAKPLIAQPLQAVLVSSLTAPLVNAGELPLPPALASLQLGAMLRVKVLQVSLPEILTQPPAAATAAAPAIPTPQAPSAPAGNVAPMPFLPAQADPLPDIALGQQAIANAKTAKIALESLRPLTQPVSSGPVAAPASPLPRSSLPVTEPVRHAPVPQGGVSSELPGIAAQVIGHEKSGATILQTRLGMLKTQLPQPLPVGTRMQVELAVQPEPDTGLPPVGGDAGKVATLAQHWPALEEALLWTGFHAPDVSRLMMGQIPSIGPKLASGLLFFIAAVKGGDIRQWLGPKALQALESKSPSLISRLQQDMGQLQQMLLDSPLQQWNSIMLPMLFGEHLEHARLFLRRDPEQGGDTPRKGKEQRFILEVDLSDLGEVQFDGFVRGASQQKQFDLIVRTNRGFPAELSEQIRATFENTMQTTGMKGYLGFQVGSQHFVRPMASTAAKPGSDPSQPILA